MKFSCGTKSFWLPMILVAGFGFLAVPLFIRFGPKPEPPEKKASPPVPVQPPVAPAVPTEPPPPPRVAAPLPEDPVLRQWVQAVKSRRREGVESSQAAFLAREAEYRAPLTTMAKEDEDARVRAFSVAVLGRMKSPPPESFFVDRLDDASEHPKISALQALEKVGTQACLSKVEGLRFSDYSDAVQAAAARTVKAVRSR